MTLLWPKGLYFLGAIPILIALYIWMLRRRRRFAVHYSSLALVRLAAPQRSAWRRHIPFGLFLLALTSLVVALSRPYSVITIPTNQIIEVLAIDVSRSMCSTDISPSRILAAENAALSFVQQQKASTQIGLVVFSGFAEVVQSPTTDPELLQTAIESLTTGHRTAIGSGILKSLDAISEVDPNVAPSVTDTSTQGPKPTPVPQGVYVPAIIILLTDGVSNIGPNPLDAAQQAADRGVRVFTIGFGTANGGEFPNCPSQYQGNEPFSGGNGTQFQGGGQFGGGFGGGVGGFRRGIDEVTLKKIAAMTGGTYYPASSASELQDVFTSLPTYLIARHEVSEVSFLYAGIGAALAALAIGLSLLWHPL